MDDIIKDRNELWDSGKRNSTLASLQANTDQDYALEYQNQGKSGYTILSYYMETIPKKYRDNAEAIYLEMGEFENYIK